MTFGAGRPDNFFRRVLRLQRCRPNTRGWWAGRATGAPTVDRAVLACRPCHYSVGSSLRSSCGAPLARAAGSEGRNSAPVSCGLCLNDARTRQSLSFYPRARRRPLIVPPEMQPKGAGRPYFADQLSATYLGRSGASNKSMTPTPNAVGRRALAARFGEARTPR